MTFPKDTIIETKRLEALKADNAKMHRELTDAVALFDRCIIEVQWNDGLVKEISDLIERIEGVL